MSQQAVMKKFMASLDKTELSGRAAIDEAIKAVSSFGSYQEVLNKFAADYKAAGNWHTFLVKYCGIILDNKDTGAISGADCGGASVKGASDILPSKGSAKYPSGDSFTISGLTIYGVPDKSELTADQQYIVKALYSWWISDALKLIKESYGLTFTAEDTTNNRLKLEFVDNAEVNYMAYVSFDDNGDGKEFESRVLCVNMAYFKNMSSSNRHGYSDVADWTLDRTIIHELVHGIMASNVNYLGDLPMAILEGGTAEVIHGIDDKRYDSIIAIAKDFESLVKSLLTTSPQGDWYSGGYIFMRYFLKQAATDTTFAYDTYRATVGVEDNFAVNYFDTVTMTGGSSADTIVNSGKNVIINAGAGVDLIKNYSEYVTLNGGAGSDTITNYNSYVTIDGGKGSDYITNEISNVNIFGGDNNDTIINAGNEVIISGGSGNNIIITGANNVSVVGGTGKDTILSGNESVSSIGAYSTIYGGAGADSIKNFADNVIIYGENNNDIVENYGAYIKAYGGKGNDSIYNYGVNAYISFGDGDDFVNNHTTATIIAGNGADTIINYGDKSNLNGGAGADIVKNYGNELTINGGSSSDSIYSSGHKVTINGGANADSIKNDGVQSYITGGSGADTITNYGDHVTIGGGTGNDSITNTGKHIVYKFGNSSGTDTVIGANNNDTLQIVSGSYSTLKSGDDFIVKVGKASITFMDFGENDLIITGNKTSANISDIVENKFIGDTEFAQEEKISEENLITFAK